MLASNGSPPNEVINQGGVALAHIRKTGKRSFAAQANLVDRQDLTPEARGKLVTQMCHVATVNHFMKPKARQRIAEAVQVTGRLLPVAETLALFQEKKEQKTVQ